jgi:hypothetical protein
MCNQNKGDGIMENSVMKTVGREAGEAAAAIQNALADKKISLVEGIDIAKEFGTLGFVAITRRSELKTVFSDGVQQDELEDIRAGFVEGYDVADDVSEEKVEGIFNGVMKTLEGIVSMFDDKSAPEVAPAVTE